MPSLVLSPQRLRSLSHNRRLAKLAQAQAKIENCCLETLRTEALEMCLLRDLKSNFKRMRAVKI